MRAAGGWEGKNPVFQLTAGAAQQDHSAPGSLFVFMFITTYCDMHPNHIVLSYILFFFSVKVPVVDASLSESYGAYPLLVGSLFPFLAALLRYIIHMSHKIYSLKVHCLVFFVYSELYNRHHHLHLRCLNTPRGNLILMNSPPAVRHPPPR